MTWFLVISYFLVGWCTAYIYEWTTDHQASNAEFMVSGYLLVWAVWPIWWIMFLGYLIFGRKR